MSAVHLIGGEKGGVGKSVVSRLLAQYFIDQRMPFIGFDSDRSHATFQRFYGQFADHTVLEDYASLDRIVEAIASEPARQVLVDLAAQAMPPLTRWLDDSGVIDMLRDERIPLRFWHVMDDGADSLALLGQLLATYGERVSYVIVLNHGRGGDFSAFHASPHKRTALVRGAAILELRRLHEASMRKIDHQDASFWAAVNHRGTPAALGMLERQRVKIWLASAYAELARVVGTAPPAQQAQAAGA